MTPITPYKIPGGSLKFPIIATIESHPRLRSLIAINLGYLFLLSGIALGINSLLSKPEWNTNMTISISLMGTGGLLIILGILGLRKTKKDNRDDRLEESEVKGTCLDRSFKKFAKGA